MAWKFSDPPTLGVYALADVLDRPASLCTVLHEVIGDWQFLDANAVGAREAKLVCLKDVVALDASITQLADLPLGWCATRSEHTAEWERTPMVPLDWEELLSAATDYVQQCQDRLQSEFQMGSWDPIEIDHESGQLTWTPGNAIRVRANVRYAGTLSLATDTWLWSWANESIPEAARSDMEWLEAFGGENNLDWLSNARCPANARHAWELAAVACYLLQADGLYRVARDGEEHILVLDDVRWAN
jgi:hypothetical protein